MQPSSEALERVLGVLRRLLDPESGCPWDLKQTPATMRLYILEEVYELMEAVEGEDTGGVREELGDCLFLLLFLNHLFESRRAFDLADVLNAAADKMVSRHPHIFAQGPTLEDADAVKAQWHQIKKAEKKGSRLGGVPKDLPALLRAHRLTERAGKAGFDWDSPEGVIESLENEIGELKQALAGDNQPAVAAELGDVLFTLANLGRHLKINAEDALRSANARFTNRFQHIEDALTAQGRSLEDATLEEMDRLWEAAKDKGL